MSQGASPRRNKRRAETTTPRAAGRMVERREGRSRQPRSGWGEDSAKRSGAKRSGGGWPPITDKSGGLNDGTEDGLGGDWGSIGLGSGSG
jgi:hypothetical protein